MPNIVYVNVNNNIKIENVLISFKVCLIVFKRFYNYFQLFTSLKTLSNRKALSAYIAFPPLKDLT